MAACDYISGKFPVCRGFQQESALPERGSHIAACKNIPAWQIWSSAGSDCRIAEHVVQNELEQIYDLHRQPLFTLALSITGCRSSAEDAVHDAFVKICKARPEHDAGSLLGYVYTSVRNSAVDFLRRQQRQERLFETIHAEFSAETVAVESARAGVSVSSPDEQLLMTEQAEMLQQALDSLESAQREIVILKIYAGLTFETIAQVTGTNSSTVESRYRRALLTLDKRMRAYK